MNHKGHSFLGFRFAPMIVEGGRVLILAYRYDDTVAATLSVSPAKVPETYLITGNDPRTDKRIRLKIVAVSAFDAAVKFCAGRLV